MGPNPAMLSPLKDKGKRIPKGLMGSQPHEFVGSRLNRAAKLLTVGVTNFGVEPVAGHDQVGIGEAGINVCELDFLLKVQPHTQLSCPFVEKLQEALSTETNKTMTTGTLHFSRYVAVDEVPVNEFVDDTLGTDGVVRCNVVHSLIRENNSPAKGVVGFVALVDLHFMCRILELEADPQI